jgi:hypothetical protein
MDGWKTERRDAGLARINSRQEASFDPEQRTNFLRSDSHAFHARTRGFESENDWQSRRTGLFVNEIELLGREEGKVRDDIVRFEMHFEMHSAN